VDDIGSVKDVFLVLWTDPGRSTLLDGVRSPPPLTGIGGECNGDEATLLEDRLGIPNMEIFGGVAGCNLGELRETAIICC